MTSWSWWSWWLVAGCWRGGCHRVTCSIVLGSAVIPETCSWSGCAGISLLRARCRVGEVVVVPGGKTSFTITFRQCRTPAGAGQLPDDLSVDRHDRWPNPQLVGRWWRALESFWWSPGIAFLPAALARRDAGRLLGRAARQHCRPDLAVRLWYCPVDWGWTRHTPRSATYIEAGGSPPSRHKPTHLGRMKVRPFLWET